MCYGEEVVVLACVETVALSSSCCVHAYCTLCLKKPDTCDFSNISDKALPILIIFGTENRQ